MKPIISKEFVFKLVMLSLLGVLVHFMALEYEPFEGGYWGGVTAVLTFFGVLIGIGIALMGIGSFLNWLGDGKGWEDGR